MASHHTSMEPATTVAGYDLFVGHCSCGKKYGPGTAAQVNAQLNQHKEKAEQS